MFCMRQEFGPAEVPLGSFTEKRSVKVRLLALVSAVVLYLGPGGAHSQQLPDFLQPPESPPEASVPPLKVRSGPHKEHPFRAHNAAGTPPSDNSYPLRFHGGRVQDWIRSYAIFWVPPGYTFEKYGSDSTYWNLIRRYLIDVGGSTFYNPTTQYCDYYNCIRNNSTWAGWVLDSRPYPHGTYTTDGDIQEEVWREISLNNWPYGLHYQFFVFTASGLLTYSANNGWSTNGTTGTYCAYHSHYYPNNTSNAPVIYANMPSQDQHWNCSAHSGNNFYAPSGDYTADGAISTLSHEQFEMITDPLGNGWYDDQGNENGDKCSYHYGTVSSDQANVTLNGHRYILQGEWSNDLYSRTGYGCTWYRGYAYN